MRTSSCNTYREHEMKDAYAAAVFYEPKGWSVDCPCDYGAIDAPHRLPAGSTYSYYFGPRIGGWTDMPSSAGRFE